MSEDTYGYILLSNRPDAELEYFWYNFKNFINNTLDRIPQVNKSGILMVDISNRFNQLQAQGKYLEIGVEMSRYILDILAQLFEYFFNNNNNRTLGIQVADLVIFINRYLQQMKRFNTVVNLDSCSKIPVTLQELKRVDLRSGQYDNIILLQILKHLNPLDYFIDCICKNFGDNPELFKELLELIGVDKYNVVLEFFNLKTSIILVWCNKNGMNMLNNDIIKMRLDKFYRSMCLA